MVSRFLIMLIIVGLMSAKGHCQSTVQKILANRPPYANRLPNCAVPKRYTGTYQHTVTFDEFNALRIAVQRLEVELGAVAKEKGIRGLTGPQGMPGPPGPTGPPGAVVHGASPKRLEDVENRLNQVIDHLNEQITNEKSRKQSPPTAPPSRPKVTKQPAANRTDEKNETPWITKLLAPLAGMVGTAYAGPVGGVIVTALTGYAGWFLFGRKKKSPQQQRRYQEQRPPPSREYQGKIVQNDGSDKYAEPNPELYEQAVKMAAKGKTGVLGDREVGVNQLQWIANKYAHDNNQI